jgi:hypothetical protein
MANSSREKIVIPVFNLFVKDIYFLHKIHTNHLPNGHINFKVSSAPCGPSTGHWIFYHSCRQWQAAALWLNLQVSIPAEVGRAFRVGCA